MTTSDVIHDIRLFLHDPQGHRWTDTDLLLYINKALGDIAVKSNAFVKVTAFQLKEGVATYNLPEDVLILNSVWFRGCKLDVVSSTSLDECKSCWVTTKGKPTSVVMDYQTLNIRLVPIPDVTTDIPITVNAEFDSQYGVLSNFQLSGQPDVVDINDETGLISSLSAFDGITVWYSYRPSINTLNDDIPLLAWIADLIKYYVCGNLLRADRDSNSRSLGNEELALYSQHLRIFKRKAQNHFSSGMLRDLSTVYNGCADKCSVTPMSFCPEQVIELKSFNLSFLNNVYYTGSYPIWWEYKNNLGEAIKVSITADEIK